MIPSWLPPTILLAPLGLAAIGTILPRSRPGLAHGLAAAGMAACTGLALWLAALVLGGDAPAQGAHATWIDAGAFALGLGTYVDGMGAVMTVIVCLLATGVLAYNAWYMHEDAQAARFPWQFCLFVFAMLTVVLADNLFMSFIGWELVGLGSYLLIGFWSAKPAASDDPEYQRLKGAGARGVLEHQLSPAHAQLKAFVMNRVGDAGFLVGIGALLAAGVVGGVHEPLTWGNLGLVAQGGALPGSFLGLGGGDLLTLACLGIFCGAIGKSAQFPLHTWLPDAMQGPTTASSIIHAATMVAAGVFLVARCYPLFTPDALAVVGWIGGITCLLAASIACVQWDLKAVLAYSTVSQLGLMFVGLGAGDEAGGRAAGLAHLFTHAMFKCLLFLCAGAVIHACAGCQDLARLGGLRRRMPITAAASLLAVLAIGGAPFFSGFYSKDAVLAAALAHAQAAGGAAWGPLLLACAGSLLTSAYMLRWWLRIFTGAERDHAITHHAHDPAWYASAVLLVLAPFTIVFVWTGGGWLDHVLGAPHGEHLAHAHHTAMYVASGLLAAGAGTALWFFWWIPRLRRMQAATVQFSAADPHAAIPHRTALPAPLAALHAACGELWGIDRLWDLVFTRILGRGLARLAARLDLGSRERLASLESGSAGERADDVLSIDGVVDGVGHACAEVGRAGAQVHGGQIGFYLAVAAGIGGVILLVGLLA